MTAQPGPTPTSGEGPAEPSTTARRTQHGPGFWVGLAVGGGIMCYGLVGLLRNLEGEALVSWLVYFVGADLLHDALVAPALFVVGALLARFLPRPVRAPVLIGCVVSAAVLLVVAVPLLDLGGNPLNPTIRPLDYTTAALTAIGIVWAAVIVVSSATALLRRRSRSA